MHEIISNQPPRTIIFILEGITVSLAITIPAILFFPEHIQPALSYQLSLGLICGSLIYGAGAAINEGCALGTINHLMNGKLNYLGTIIGMASGIFIYLFVINFLRIGPINTISNIQGNILLLIPILIIVWVVLGIRIYKLTGMRIIGDLKNFITSPVTRDIVSILILGTASGVLYLTLGQSWDYTRLIILSEESMFYGTQSRINLVLLSITVSGFLFGIAIATKLSKSFQLLKIDIKSFCRKLTGGVFMGIGACLIPGGNDTLIFYSLPGVALHAPVAILLILFAIAIILKIKSNFISSI